MQALWFYFTIYTIYDIDDTKGDIIVHVQIFASDSFLELTEYTREEILGRNCRYENCISYLCFVIILISCIHLPPIIGAFKLDSFLLHRL